MRSLISKKASIKIIDIFFVIIVSFLLIVIIKVWEVKKEEDQYNKKMKMVYNYQLKQNLKTLSNDFNKILIFIENYNFQNKSILLKEELNFIKNYKLLQIDSQFINSDVLVERYKGIEILKISKNKGYAIFIDIIALQEELFKVMRKRNIYIDIKNQQNEVILRLLGNKKDKNDEVTFLGKADITDTNHIVCSYRNFSQFEFFKNKIGKMILLFFLSNILYMFFRKLILKYYFAKLSSKNIELYKNYYEYKTKLENIQYKYRMLLYELKVRNKFVNKYLEYIKENSQKINLLLRIYEEKTAESEIIERAIKITEITIGNGIKNKEVINVNIQELLLNNARIILDGVNVELENQIKEKSKKVNISLIGFEQIYYSILLFFRRSFLYKQKGKIKILEKDGGLLIEFSNKSHLFDIVITEKTTNGVFLGFSDLQELVKFYKGEIKYKNNKLQLKIYYMNILKAVK